MPKPEMLIRIYKRDDEGKLSDDRQDYSTDDFCGAVPRVGDFIVSPEVRNIGEGGKSYWWENRIIQVVEAVYLRPDKRTKPESDSWVCVVVSERSMTEAEQALL